MYSDGKKILEKCHSEECHLEAKAYTLASILGGGCDVRMTPLPLPLKREAPDVGGL